MRLGSGKGRDCGAILILTLWVLALLSLMALGINARVRLHMRAMRWEMLHAQSREMLLTEAAKCFERYSKDATSEYDAYSEDSMKSLIFDSEKIFANMGIASSPVGPFQISMNITDESGKINVNVADESLLREVLREAGAGENAALIASAIADWRDPDDVGFSESSFYGVLVPPYAAANSELQQLDELLFVSGITAALYYGEDANLNGMLDRAEDDGDATYPPDNMDGNLQPGLRDLFTVYGDGEVNINTSPLSVLRAALRNAGLSEYDADKLALGAIAKRDGPDRIAGTSDDAPFKSAPEIVEGFVAILGNAAQAEPLAGQFGVVSHAARCRATLRWLERHAVMASEIVAVRDEDEVKAAAWQDL
jgi:type II secretory pathway component PulK